MFHTLRRKSTAFFSYTQIFLKKKLLTIIVYILRIYTEDVQFFLMFWRYPMVILWLCYGYPMVRDADWPVIASVLPLCRFNEDVVKFLKNF